MIIESLDEYLETVTGYIFDNDKIVTYKWLSKELEVHVNIAKQILWEFWHRYKKEKSFDCAFLLMGLLHDGGMRVEVVKEKDLLTVKEKFAKLLSEHIYSLQKVLPEIHLLGLTENGDVKFSAIKCLENNERSDEEIHRLRWGAASSEVQSVPREKAKPIPEPVNEQKEKSPEKKQADAKKATQKKGFNNLFGKMSNKQKSPSSSNAEKIKVNSTSNTKQTSSESSKKAGQKGGLSSFLQHGKNPGKSANSVSPEAKKSTSSTAKESTSSTTKESTSSTTKESTSSTTKESTSSTTKERAEKKVTSEKNDKQKNKRGKKRTRSKEKSDIVKRRKRITIQSDSSDGESSDGEQEEEMELAPSPETVSAAKARSPSPLKVKLEGGKRKVLKKVDKTFEEDGFFVTKKVHVYESCSEDEVEVAEQSKKSVTPESRPETKGKKSTKQTTLMSFFKKS
ncbi:uncharacterized protein LOC143372125 [Andrena cerasifolii]|uniref:uncharacterized protein LOC143372125 n=1 Tax=Andrena cerasifolii TaxID=2819439 RepID=UPI004037E952